MRSCQEHVVSGGQKNLRTSGTGSVEDQTIRKDIGATIFRTSEEEDEDEDEEVIKTFRSESNFTSSISKKEKPQEEEEEEKLQSSLGGDPFKEEADDPLNQ